MPDTGPCDDLPQPGGEDDPLLETIASNVPIVVFTLDDEGVFTRSEGKGLAGLGLEPNEVVGESVFDVYADYPAILDAMERALAGQSVNEVVEVDDNAYEVWYRPGSEDEIDRVTGVAIDITDRIRHERLLERLNEATRELVVADSKEDIADRIVEINRRVLDEPASVVWFHDPDAGVLEPVARANPILEPDSPYQHLEDLGPIAPGTAEMAVFERGETTFFEDYTALGDASHPGTTLGAILAVPIGEYGLLTVGAPDADDIGTSTPDLVEILARDAAVALERVERESAVERLHVATRALIEAETREDIAERTVEAAEGILGHPQTVLRLLSEDGTRLEPVAMTDWILDTIPDRPTFRVGEGPIGTAFERQEPIRFDRSELRGPMSHESTQSLLCMPIGRYGVLSIGHPESTAFEESDVKLVMILASNAESALDRIDREIALERQNERLEAFAGILSHDLRNPLNVISGRLALAREDERHFEPMEEAVERMDAIIDDVLDLAREGRAVADPEPIRLENAGRMAWETVDTREANLVVEEDREVLADASRLRRLLENLFRNAIEYGGAGVTVRVGATDDGFFVGDDGPGIPREDLDSVFEMGYASSGGGTGLGLSIVTDIAETHGWTVAASEGRDGGARFEVSGVRAS